MKKIVFTIGTFVEVSNQRFEVFAEQAKAQRNPNFAPLTQNRLAG